MGFDSPIHWLIVIFVVALLGGGSRVGNLMGELGKGIRVFKQNLADVGSPGHDQAVKTSGPLQSQIPGGQSGGGSTKTAPSNGEATGASEPVRDNRP